MMKKYISGLVVLVVALQVNAKITDKKKMADMTLKKLSESVPTARPILQEQTRPRDMSVVKPPRSSRLFLYDDDPLRVEYNKLVDEEIKKLYTLSSKYKTSRNRGEIWLRLAERYVEKGNILDMKVQDDYDKRMKKWEETKKGAKPVLPKTNPGKPLFAKAIQLYEYFIRDFPKDPKVAQALYFLGYSNFEIGNEKKGEAYYKELTQRFPSSAYVDESHFALGEYYFEKENWNEALENYGRLVQKKTARLHLFSLYKTAWCFYRMGRYPAAVDTLERVIRSDGGGGEAAEGTREVNKLRLREEAIKDYVAFYSQTGKFKEAEDDFNKATRSEKKTVELLDALAYRYSYSGNIPASTYLFKKLITMAPEAEKAAKYQYQIVQDNLNVNNLKAFKIELAEWIQNYGPASSWASANSDKKEMLKETFALQETTLRNHTLRLHATAVSVKSEFSQQTASDSYKMYLHFFKDSPKHSEMRFFYGELLFDMRAYEKAAQQYQWLAENDKKSPYYEKSVINNVLSLEKLLPKDAEMENRRNKAKDKLTKIPYAPEVKKFEQASLLYLQAFPKGDKADEIKKRLGALYYVHNDFEPALGVFRGIIKENPNSKDVPVAAEYILDIHNIRNDIDTFQKEGNELLKNPTIAKSPVGKEIRDNLNKAKFLVADSLSKNGKNYEAAKAFESFAKTQPNSPQVVSAMFNAAVNYEKAGSGAESVRMYENVLAVPGKENEGLRQDVKNSLAEIYKKTGQLEKAALMYEQFGRGITGTKAKNALNNASILWVALGRTEKAMSTFSALDKMSTDKEKNEYIYERAEMFHRQKDYGKAMTYYDQFLRLGWRDTLRSLKATHTIAETYAKRGQTALAKQWYEKTVGLFKERGSKTGAKFAGQAKFWLARRSLDEMRAIRLGTAEKTIVNAFANMKALQKTLIKDLAEVIKIDYGPSIVAALAAEAESYEVIANAFKNSPVPREYSNAEQAKQFKQLAQQEGDGFLQKAKGAYKAAFEKGLAIEAFGDPLLSSARNYHRLAPGESKMAGEMASIGSLVDKAGL
ncbi:MAG: tetratricopeptide repeat protein [Bdellovibrionales bacterium]|nr:tetratricopeptide repeat protein [Bdellovibrionales bacterium]